MTTPSNVSTVDKANSPKVVSSLNRPVSFYVSVNSGIVLLYWNIGRRIREDILKGTRATYGEEIVSALAKQLAAEFGQGYSRRNLFNMIRFAEVFLGRTLCTH